MQSKALFEVTYTHRHTEEQKPLHRGRETENTERMKGNEGDEQQGTKIEEHMTHRTKQSAMRSHRHMKQDGCFRKKNRGDRTLTELSPQHDLISI